MNNSFQASGLSFDILKLKYQVIKPQYCISMMGILNRRDVGTKLCVQEKNMLANSGFSTIQTQDSSSFNPLYQILNKVELGGELSQVDIDWLTKEHLFDTIEFIQTEQDKKNQIKNQIKSQLDILKKQYKISTYLDCDSDIRLLQILKNIQNLRTLSESEVNWLKTINLVQPLEIYQKQELQKFARQQEIEEIKEATEEKIKASDFLQLKLNYKATKYKDSHSFSRLYPILLKLDRREQLIASEIEWLKNNQLFDTLEIYQKRESERIAREQEAEEKRKAEKHFSELKIKYRVSSWDSSIPNRLYLILCKIDKGELLTDSDLKWLKLQDFSSSTGHIEKIQHLTELKVKYKAAQHQDTSPSSHLYKILKQLDTGKRLNPQDGEWLKKQQLLETFAIFQERETVQRRDLPIQLPLPKRLRSKNTLRL